eukprot:evm.model.NODE_2188_length_5621_cov_20.926882.3
MCQLVQSMHGFIITLSVQTQPAKLRNVVRQMLLYHRRAGATQETLTLPQDTDDEAGVQSFFPQNGDGIDRKRHVKTMKQIGFHW